MSVKIGHASINENGKVSGGKAGDQTGKEVCIRDWYSKNWQYVLRPKSEAVAENSATFVEGICANNNVGYDQPNRNTLFKEAYKEGFVPANITTPCSTDCSEFMSCAAYAAGVPIDMKGNAPTTRNMVDIFKNTGCYDVLTDSKYLTSPDLLKRGDILVSPGHHTVMVIYNSNTAKIEQVTEQTNNKITEQLITKHSNVCTEMIKRFEGCRLTAYKCAAGVWTIGYGHTEGVTSGMVINQDTANAFLEADIAKFDKHVASYNDKYKWTQNEFDALVSFAFNLGTIKKLTADGTRTIAQIADHWCEYCHAGGKELVGLKKRREEELQLFLKIDENSTKPAQEQSSEIKNKKSNEEIADEVIKGLWGSGSDRRNKLEAAGYNYVDVQRIVNSKLSSNNSKAVYYTVKKGDTLTSIAKRYGYTVKQIADKNNIKDVNKINVGQVLRIV